MLPSAGQALPKATSLGETSPDPPISVQPNSLNYSELPGHSKLGPRPGTGHVLPSLASTFRKYLLNDGYLGGSVPWTCSGLSQRHGLLAVSSSDVLFLRPELLLEARLAGAWGA